METTEIIKENAELKKIIAQQKNELEKQGFDIEHLNAIIDDLKRQLVIFQRLKFAKKSEKQANGEYQLSLFDEPEQISDEKVEEIEDATSLTEENSEENSEKVETIEVPAHSRKKSGRRPIPSDIPREDIYIDIDEAKKKCPCGCELTKIGEEVSEKLSIEPAKISVKRYIRPKYACTKGCKGADDLEGNVKMAKMPPQIIPQGIITPSLLAYIITSKYADGLPLYRQCNIFERFGVDIPKSTMSSWVLQAGKKCKPLLDLLYLRLRQGKYINLDETTVQVLKEKDRENTTKSYMWVAKGGQEDKPALVFHYAPSRSGDVAREILGDFKGFLQTDGYAGYNAIGKTEDIIHVGCLVHVRRKFIEVTKSGGKNAKSGVASQVVALIGNIYKIEKEIQGKSESEILALRDEKVRPILEKIEALLKSKKDIVPPQSLLGKAISYALGQWDRIVTYLQAPFFTPDNNTVENAIRPFVIGRKNWLFSGSPRGADASACLYSLIETAKYCGLEPYKYLIDTFEKLPYAKSDEDYEALLPKKSLEIRDIKN